MKIHCLQHVEFEGLGIMHNYFTDRQDDIFYTRFFENAYSLPDPKEVDVLLIMGGPMSVNDEKTHPWLKEEKRFVKEIIRSRKPIVGICLGAQIIASCLGSKIYPNTEKEIGWFPIMLNDKSPFDKTAVEKEIVVFHWHGETFDLPKKAIHIASSEACRNQAFIYRDNIIGLQFHVEATPNSIEKLLVNCEHELVNGSYIQKKEEILHNVQEKCDSINNVCIELLANLIQKIPND